MNTPANNCIAQKNIKSIFPISDVIINLLNRIDQRLWLVHFPCRVSPSWSQEFPICAINSLKTAPRLSILCINLFGTIISFLLVALRLIRNVWSNKKCYSWRIDDRSSVWRWFLPDKRATKAGRFIAPNDPYWILGYGLLPILLSESCSDFHKSRRSCSQFCLLIWTSNS